MSLGRLNFDDLGERDLLDLVAAGVPEGQIVEYKRDPYGRADADVKEFLKDVTAMANTRGGHIIVGLEEADGVAKGLSPIKALDRDIEIQRLDSLVRDGIEPRIVGVQIRAIDVSSGGFVLILRIPRSWNPPHRVIARGSNRFFIRNSSGVHEASIDELRSLFTLSSTAVDRARAFHTERVARIITNEGPVSLAGGGGKIIIHLVPLATFSAPSVVDLRSASKASGSFRPISADGMTPKFNFDGFINIRGGVPCYGYTQVFRNGVIEATKASILRERDGLLLLPTSSFEAYTLGALHRYLNGMKLLGLQPPIVAMITLEGIHGAVLGTSQDTWDDRPDPITRSTLELPDILIENFGTPADYNRQFRPAIDALWNAGGYLGSLHYNEDGTWKGRAD
jgi:hypothetical protein